MPLEHFWQSGWSICSCWPPQVDHRWFLVHGSLHVHSFLYPRKLIVEIRQPHYSHVAKEVVRQEQEQVFRMGMVDHHMLVAEALAQAAEEVVVVELEEQQEVAQKGRKRRHLLEQGLDIQLEQALALDIQLVLIPYPTEMPGQAVEWQAQVLDAALDPLGVPLEVGRPCLRKDSIAAERLPSGSQTQERMPQNQECMVAAADTAAAVAAGEDIAVTAESQRMQEVQSDMSSSKDWVVVEELHNEEHHQQELELELQRDRMDYS